MVLIFHLIEDNNGLANVVSRCFTRRSCFELSKAWNIRSLDRQAGGRILQGAQHLLSGLSLIINESPSSLRCRSVLAYCCKIGFRWSPVLIWWSHWFLIFRKKLIVSQNILIIQMSLSLLIKVSSISIRSIQGYRTHWLCYLCWLLLLNRSLLTSASCGILVNRRDTSDSSQVRLTLILALCIAIAWSDLTLLGLYEVVVPGISGGSNVNLRLYSTL